MASVPCPLALILGTRQWGGTGKAGVNGGQQSLVAGAEAIGALGRLLYVFLPPQRCHAHLG
jgi:hypothetical protein